MARFSKKSAAAALMLSSGGLALLLFTHVAAGQPAQMVNSRTANLTATSIPYIDAHTHIDQRDPEGAVQLLLNAMDKLNGARAFIQTEPYGPGQPGGLGCGDDPADGEKARRQACRSGRRWNAQSHDHRSRQHRQCGTRGAEEIPRAGRRAASPRRGGFRRIVDRAFLAAAIPGQGLRICAGGFAVDAAARRYRGGAQRSHRSAHGSAASRHRDARGYGAAQSAATAREYRAARKAAGAQSARQAHLGACRIGQCRLSLARYDAQTCSRPIPISTWRSSTTPVSRARTRRLWTASSSPNG